MKRIVGLIIFMVTVTNMFSATITWDGGGDGSKWSDPDNWSCNCLPSQNDLVELSGDHVIIPSGIQVDIHILEMYNSSTLELQLGSKLNLKQVYSNNSDLDNNGEICATQYINELGTHHNLANGVILIQTHPNSILNINSLQNTGTFQNDGSLQVLYSDNIGIYSFVNTGTKPTFINNGKMCVRNADNNSIHFNGLFSNFGHIEITEGQATGIYVDGLMDNHSSGEINVQVAAGGTYRGIYVVDSFQNLGRIWMRGNLDLSNPLAGGNYFYNDIDGILILNNESQIYSVGGEIYNYGEITIKESATGIRCLASTQFNPAIFENHNTVAIEGASTLAILNSNFSHFTNESCAILTINAEVRNFNEFINNGFIKQTTNSSGFLDNQGTFTNNGIIEDLDGSFTSMVTTNSGYTIQKVNGSFDVGDVVNNILAGNGNNITVQNNDFVPSLNLSSESAGVYNPGGNTWSIVCNASGRDEIFIPFLLSSCPVEYMKLVLQNAIGLKTGVLNTWQGNINNSWSNSANWSLGTIPRGCEHVNIPAGNTVVIDKHGLARSINIGNGSTLNLLPGFNLDLYGSNLGGIRIDGGTLNIAGEVNIQHTAIEGLRNENAGVAVIGQNGSVHIEDLDVANAHGIINQSSFTINGIVSILLDETSTNEALQNEGSLVIGNTGKLYSNEQIINTTTNASITNFGKVILDDLLSNESNADFVNEQCAELILKSALDNSGYLENSGIIRQFFNGFNLNSGSIENYGIIDDEYGSFQEDFDVNLGLYLATIFNLFEVDFGANYFLPGSLNNLSIDGLYLDSTLCFSAGYYDQNTNTWTPDSAALDLDRFYLSIDNGSCLDTCSVKLSSLVSEEMCPGGTEMVNPIITPVAKNWNDPSTWNLGKIPNYCSDVSLIGTTSGSIIIDPSTIARCNTIQIPSSSNVNRVLEVLPGGVLDVIAKE